MRVRTYKDGWQMLLSLSSYVLLNRYNNVYIRISDNPFITVEEVYGYTTYYDLVNLCAEWDCIWSIQKQYIKGKAAKYFFNKKYRSIWLNNIEFFSDDPKKFDEYIDIYLVHKS